jgi:hypothetical protein
MWDARGARALREDLFTEHLGAAYEEREARAALEHFAATARENATTPRPRRGATRARACDRSGDVGQLTEPSCSRMVGIDAEFLPVLRVCAFHDLRKLFL